MISRRLMVAVNVDTPPDKLVKLLLDQSYTRIPVFERTPDNFIGPLLTRDFVAAVSGTGTLPPLLGIIRPIATVTESTKSTQ
jgi:CBS domain containing-hemolysin-like protein